METKTDRGKLWVIMNSWAGAAKSQLMQITEKKLRAEFPAMNEDELHNMGLNIMNLVAQSMLELGEVVHDKRTQMDMRDTALQAVKRGEQV